MHPRREVIDLDAGTLTTEDHGVVTSTRSTPTECAAYGPPALDALGVAMTVLAVEGEISVSAAAKAAQVTEDALVNEALAWSVAAGLPQ